jgi:hypothetical protein
MKQTTLLAVFVLALAFSAMAIGSASANNGNGAVTTHFTATYVDPNLGPVDCSGEHIVKPAPNAFTKDSETCLIENGYPAGTYHISYFGGWLSDFNGARAVRGTITVVGNGDGTSTDYIVAYY